MKKNRLIKKRVGAFLCAGALMFLNTFTVWAGEEPSFWAADEVYAAIEDGFVPEGLTKDYTKNITREEFSELAVSFLAKLKGTTKEEMVSSYPKAPFSDTENKSVAAAYALNILDGRGDGLFAPNDTIKRQEAAKIIINTYSAYTGEIPTAEEMYLTYNDTEEISSWAAEYVKKVTSMGLMKGDHNNFFTPNAPYTTEQSIITFERLYAKIENDEAKVPLMDNVNPKIDAVLYANNGSLIKENTGEEVVLNGVNLGSWLMMEMWMCPIETEDEEFSYSDALDILERRFGTKKATELITLYEDSFITEKDFDNIQALGFNCVRLPFWYRNFMNENGNWFTLRQGDNPGFKRLDKIIEMCRERGIYIILDMHGCPGGQSMNHSTGVSGKNELYNNEENLSTMENLWLEIAKRYKDEPVIAAYDIMNEPQNNGGYTGLRAWQPGSAEAVKLTNGVYDRMIKAIRKTGDRHVITVEGIWSIYNLPNPASYNWDNMMYQLHLYDTDETMIDEKLAELTDIAREKYKTVPLVGEYNNKQSKRYAAGRYKSLGINRIKWTYKAVNAWYDGWGLYNKNIDRIDIKTASEEEIRRAFGDEMLTDTFAFDIKEYNKTF